MLQRMPLAPGHNFARVRVIGDFAGIPQAKLRVSQPGDQYEQEADQIADQVMRMSEPDVRPTSPLKKSDDGLAQRQVNSLEEEEDKLAQAKLVSAAITPLVQRQMDPDEDEEEIQMKRAESHSGPAVAQAAEPQVRPANGSGRPLDSVARTFMEARFGHDFGQVRVHTDSGASESAGAVNARAYTLGQDVVFGAGQYAPGSAEGRRLLAHELTHVIQQGGDARVCTLQRAETDTSQNCASLTDTRSDVNDRINKAVGNAQAKVGKPLDAERVIDEFAKELAVNTSVGRTAIEDWASTLGATKVDLPAQSATKYKGVSFRLWVQSGFPILNPTMKVSGVCIGSDKLGHFLQQGFQYYEEARRTKGGTVAAAEESGERTEGGGFGLKTTGVFSNADLEANRQGLKFYDDLKANPSLTFDIVGYISSKWNEETNPSFYEGSVAKQVWSNLLSRKWSGTFDVGGGPKINITMDLKATTAGVVTGTYEYPDSGGQIVKGTISNGNFSFDTKSVKGQSLVTGSLTTETPVSGVVIDFEWSEGTDSGSGKWTSRGESKLTGTWGWGHLFGGNWDCE